MAKKEVVRVKVKGKGYQTLTEKLIKDSLGNEEPGKLLDWMRRLHHNTRSMNFDPYNSKGKYIEGSEGSKMKGHYGENK